MDVQVVDALELECDVLVLKHAQGVHGVDRQAVAALESTYPQIRDELPLPGRSRTYAWPHPGGPAAIVFVGVPPMRDFLYDEIRSFGAEAISRVAAEFASARTVGVTMQGVSSGLDERACLESEVGGLLDGMLQNPPPELKRIVLAERDAGRAERLERWLEDLSKTGAFADLWSLSFDVSTAHVPVSERPTVFVAMPFHPDFEDVYNFGIQGALHEVGLKCERLDQESFFGDVVQEMRRRIERSRFMVADLTGANPNVYLEVGYAWAAQKPVVLVVHSPSIETSLKFDVRGHRALPYVNITELKKKLAQEATSLLEQNLV